MILTFANYALFGSPNISSSCLVGAITLHSVLMQNLLGSCFYFNIPLWSIAVEFIAYLIFPFVIFLKIRWELLLAVGFFLYLSIYLTSDTIDLLNGAPSVMRCTAGFICGIAASQVSRRYWPSAVQCLLFIALFIALTQNLQVFALLIMLFITIVTANNSGVFAQFSKQKWPYLVGRSSFSIYLAHIPVSMVVSPIAYKIESETGIELGSDWRLILPIKIIASIVVGIFAYQWIEVRFDEFFSKRYFSKNNALMSITDARPK